METGARSKAVRKAEKQTMTDRMAAWQKRKVQAGVAWRDVDPIALKAALHTIINTGCAVMFAKARGSDGIMVKVYDDGEPASDFAANADELNEVLMALVEAFSNGSEDVYVAVGGQSVIAGLAAD